MGSDARSRSRSALWGASVLVDVVVGEDEVVAGVVEVGGVVAEGVGVVSVSPRSGGGGTGWTRGTFSAVMGGTKVFTLPEVFFGWLPRSGAT